MTLLSVLPRCFVILLGALLGAALLAPPAQAEARRAQGDSPAKVRILAKAPGHRSHVTAHDRAQRAAGFNHNETLDSLHRIERTPMGGRPGTFIARQHSYVKVPFLEYKANFTDNVASASWLGMTPYNADLVRLTVIWSTDGVKIGFNGSVGTGGASAGASFSGHGSKAMDVTTLRKRWSLSSYVDSVRFRGVAIYRVTHTAAGKFTFPSSAITVSTSDSALV
jgi:hypothetical protein